MNGDARGNPALARRCARPRNGATQETSHCGGFLRVFRLFRGHSVPFPSQKSGKLTISRFLSFFCNARFAWLQFPDSQDDPWTLRWRRRRRIPGFPGNFPRVHGWGGGVFCPGGAVFGPPRPSPPSRAPGGRTKKRLVPACFRLSPGCGRASWPRGEIFA